MSDTSVHVHFLPALLSANQIAGGTAVMIDVLRASSTITTALANGADCVVPCATTEQARQTTERASGGNVLLGGERGGIRLVGFDCGNSPAEYSRATVAGRRLVFTTTNGTQALLKSVAAESVLVGAFVNLSAIRNALIKDGRPVHLVCAGTDGIVTGEDVLFAGAVVWSLTRKSSADVVDSPDWKLTDSARIARGFWDQQVLLNVDEPIHDVHGHTSWPATLSAVIGVAMRHTHGGQNLLELKYDSDIDLCSQVDSVPLVPEYDAATGEICTR
jgi:2-phosphosulfolactate phosphatase